MGIQSIGQRQSKTLLQLLGNHGDYTGRSHCNPHMQLGEIDIAIQRGDFM